MSRKFDNIDATNSRMLYE